MRDYMRIMSGSKHAYLGAIRNPKIILNGDSTLSILNSDGSHARRALDRITADSIAPDPDGECSLSVMSGGRLYSVRLMSLSGDAEKALREFGIYLYRDEPKLAPAGYFDW
jgi:hypothetical protein